tara:strand:+ start:1753 stop:2565 length:813 start_codon:yes stop_codon:yes gene_type:complete
MGILDPWREARAGILAQPFVAPDPFVNPGYNLPDHPNAPYRPTPDAVNEEVVAATQAAGTPFAPRRRFQDQGGDGWSPTSAEMPEMPEGNPLTAPTDMRNLGMMSLFPGGAVVGAGAGSYYGANAADKMGLHSTGINPNISALNALTNAMSFGALGTNLTDQYNNFLSEASTFPDDNNLGGYISNNYSQPNPGLYVNDPGTSAAPITPVTSMQLTPTMTHPQQDLAYSQMQLAQETYGSGDYSDGGGGYGGYSGGESDNAGNDTGDRGAY